MTTENTLSDREVLEGLMILEQKSHLWYSKFGHRFYIIKFEIDPTYSINISDDQISRIADELFRQMRSHGRTKILVDIAGDAFVYWILHFINRLENNLITKQIMSREDFYYLCGAYPCDKNFRNYDIICEKYQFTKLNLILFSSYETYLNSMLNDEKYSPVSIDLTPRIKEKKFLCFNRNPRPQRVVLFTELMKLELVDQSFYSAIYFDYIDFYSRYQFENHFPRLCDSVVEYISQGFDKGLGFLPRILNHHSTDFTNPANTEHKDAVYYENSYFSVVTETKYLCDIINDPYPTRDVTLDCFFFTEKTWKPIICFHPFIQVNRPGALQLLRDIGYKTFHPYIDETYDLIEDDEERLIAIVNEIKRLCEFSDKQWLNFQENIRPLVEHNHSVLSQKKPILKCLVDPSIT